LLPYWILFGIFAAGAVESGRRLHVGPQRAPIFIAAGVFTALMIGLRYRVGGDWGNYERIFEEVEYLNLRDSLGGGDPGYYFLNWLSWRLGFEIWFVNLICGVIFTWGLIKFARQQPNPWLATLVAVPYLIIVVAMGYTRQAVAIGFVLAGLATVNRTSIVRFSFYVLGGVLFHKSAIVILPIVALAAARNRIVIFGLLLVLGLALYYIFVAEVIDAMVTNYIDASYQSQGAAIRAAMNLPPALLFLAYRRQFNLPPAEDKLWRNISFAAIGAVAVLFVSSATTAVDRLALYLIPLQMCVLSRLPHVFRTRTAPNGQMILGLIAYSAVIQFVWLGYANNSQYWLPYQLYPLLSNEQELQIAS
jgi:EpsG family